REGGRPSRRTDPVEPERRRRGQVEGSLPQLNVPTAVVRGRTISSTLRGTDMNRNKLWLALTGLVLVSGVILMGGLQAPADAQAADAAATDPLPSWNDGPTKKAILDFVQTTTDKTSPKYVPPAARIVTFDQDGTLWVEHPMYTQVIYCLERVPAV